MKRVLVFLLFYVIALSSCDKTDNRPKEIINKYLELYMQEEIETAFETLFATNPYMSAKDSSVIQLSIQINNAVKQVGKCRGYSFVTQKNFSDDYILYSYILKHDLQPLRFNFIFYKPIDKWQIQNVSFDVDFDSELERAAEALFLENNID